MNYTRNKHIITNTKTGKTAHYNSINQAKRTSRGLQKEGHTVRVIKTGN